MFACSQKALQKLSSRSNLTLPSLCRALSCGTSLNIKNSNVNNEPSGLAFDTSFDCDVSKISIDTIKTEFCQLGGGSISLKKDNVTRIAQLQLVNSIMKNAYSGKMMCDLNDAMIELENWEEGKGLVILSDDEKFFSAGVDRNFIKAQNSYEGGYKMATLMHDTMWRLNFLPMLSVSLVRGRALGGGAEISTATDFRAFSPSGSLEFIQAKLGLTSNYSGSRLVRLIGQKETLKLLLSCRRVGSQEAKKMGLCDLVTYAEGDRAIRETLLWLEENYLGHISGDVLKSMKSICVRPCENIEDNLEHEKGQFCSHWGGKSFAKAINRKNKH
jgi:ethylmalonyl-CoA/methylmalonyl-CoA decarboxylase